jgi:hypothetical protein
MAAAEAWGTSMRKILAGVALLLLGMLARSPDAAAVEYVKVCSLYGAGFYYIPGTDQCYNPITGDVRQQTAYGTLRTLSPMASDIAVLQSQVGALQGAQQAMQARFDAEFRNANDGSAIAMALEDPYLTESEHFGVKVNWGNYMSSNALGVTFAGVLAERGSNRLTLSGGVAFTGSNVGGHAGLQFSW